jgi:hypothetical protein
VEVLISGKVERVFLLAKAIVASYLYLFICELIARFKTPCVDVLVICSSHE